MKAIRSCVVSRDVLENSVTAFNDLGARHIVIVTYDEDGVDTFVAIQPEA